MRVERTWQLAPGPAIEPAAGEGARQARRAAAAGTSGKSRSDYLRGHIAAVTDALRQGVPMAGYMVWSLMDNFEWSFGYAKRFGIVHVDYATLERTPKHSALWYRDFVARCRAARQS